jgi:hypothetical protein
MSGVSPVRDEWALMRSWLRLEGHPQAFTVESGVLQVAAESDEVSAGASSVLALSCSAAAHRQLSGLAASLRRQQAAAVRRLQLRTLNSQPVRGEISQARPCASLGRWQTIRRAVRPRHRSGARPAQSALRTSLVTATLQVCWREEASL